MGRKNCKGCVLKIFFVALEKFFVLKNKSASILGLKQKTASAY